MFCQKGLPNTKVPKSLFMVVHPMETWGGLTLLKKPFLNLLLEGLKTHFHNLLPNHFHFGGGKTPTSSHKNNMGDGETPGSFFCLLNFWTAVGNKLGNGLQIKLKLWAP